MNTFDLTLVSTFIGVKCQTTLNGIFFCRWEGGSFTFNVAIDILLRDKFRVHIQAFGPIYKKMSEILRLQNVPTN